MSLLVDTHLVLWAAYVPERLSPTARARLTDKGVQPHVSAASIWEVVIKAGLGRSDFLADPAALRSGLAGNGRAELPVRTSHALEVAKLPLHHSDPFDRILVAQARWEGWPLLTADRALECYGPPVELVWMWPTDTCIPSNSGPWISSNSGHAAQAKPVSCPRG